MKRSLPTLGLFALAVPLAIGQVALRLNLPAGKSYTYLQEMTMDQPMVGKVFQKVTQSVKVLKKAGDVYQIQITTLDAKTTAPKGSPMESSLKSIQESMKGASVTGSYTSRGQMIGRLTTKGGNEMMRAMAGGLGGSNIGFMGVEFPAKPVSVGTSWTASMDFKKMMESMGGQMPAGVKVTGKPFTMKYTVKSFGNLNGKRVVNLSSTLSGGMDMSMTAARGRPPMKISMIMKGSGTTAIDAASGLPRHSNTTMTMTTTEPQAMTQKMNVKMTLLRG